MRRFAAFTIVELLVVITIIVVLLALLAPALDTAIYEAELAVCGAQLKAIGTGVTTYAMEHKRHYPYRSGVRDLSHYYWPNSLSQGANNTTHDDRPELRPYVAINAAFNDPLSKRVDFDGSHPQSWVWVPYSLWFGFQYAVQPVDPRQGTRQDRGMFKMGDELEWSDQKRISPAERYRVLASDMFWTRNDDGDYVGAHPDKAGRMTTWSGENISFGAEAKALSADPDAEMTVSRWNLMRSPQDPPGPWDSSYIYDDGSLATLRDVTHEDWRTGSRISRVGATSRGGDFINDWAYIAR